LVKRAGSLRKVPRTLINYDHLSAMAAVLGSASYPVAPQSPLLGSGRWPAGMPGMYRGGTGQYPIAPAGPQQMNFAAAPAPMPVATAAAPAPMPVATAVAQPTGGKPEAAADALDKECSEAWLNADAVQRRRQALGMEEPLTASFVQRCEFISLGSYCGVSRSLQALGVKKFSYPFDWVRSPVDGVTHCLETDFADFLTFAVCRDEGPKGILYGSTRWGGSFWHHRPELPKTRADFTRRIERLLGLSEKDVASDAPRFFVRACNSTRELDATLELHEALKRALPKSRIYLLILIDLQSENGAMRLTNSEDVLFYRVDEAVFAENGKWWTMQKGCEMYAEAIAFAASFWAGKADARAAALEVSTLEELGAACDQFDGGNAATDLFFPQRFKGLEVQIQRPDPQQPGKDMAQKPKLTLFAKAANKTQQIAQKQNALSQSVPAMDTSAQASRTESQQKRHLLENKENALHQTISMPPPQKDGKLVASASKTGKLVDAADVAAGVSRKIMASAAPVPTPTQSFVSAPVESQYRFQPFAPVQAQIGSDFQGQGPYKWQMAGGQPTAAPGVVPAPMLLGRDQPMNFGYKPQS